MGKGEERARRGRRREMGKGEERVRRGNKEWLRRCYVISICVLLSSCRFVYAVHVPVFQEHEGPPAV